MLPPCSLSLPSRSSEISSCHITSRHVTSCNVTEPHKGSTARQGRAGQAKATLALYSELTQQLESLSAAATVDGAVCGVRGVNHYGLKNAEALRTHTHTRLVLNILDANMIILRFYTAQCSAMQCSTVHNSTV